MTRIRSCSPWGLDGGASSDLESINPAFKISTDSNAALNDPRGVINYFYYFKTVVFFPTLETSLQMRAVKAIAEVMWNVNAHYRDKATDTLGTLIRNPARRQPKSRRTTRNINIALAYGITRVMQYLLPPYGWEAQVILDTLSGGFNSKSYAAHFRDPSGVGNACAADLIRSLKTDGWNSEGDLSPWAPFPYADYTRFTPANTPYSISKPTKWQPLLESNQMGYFQAQTPTTPQLTSPRIRTYAVPQSWIQSRRGSGAWTGDFPSGQQLTWMKRNATKLIDISAKLTDTQKLIAEFFDSKIVSYGGFERLFAYQNNWGHEQWIEFDQMSACFYDATILAWKEKIRTNNIRPMSAIRWLAQNGHLPKTVRSWAGPGKGTRTIRTDAWQSFLRTMPHTEWPSGTSCLCQVFTEWIRLYNGKKGDKIDLSLKWRKGCSATEPDATPKRDLSYRFTSLKALNSICSQSRQWAGVHFDSSLKGGHTLCSDVARQCYNKVQRMKAGRL